MNPQIANFFAVVVYVVIMAIVLRSLLSWLPGGQGSFFGRLVERVTEPILAPIRNIVPRVGMLDLSPMIVIVALYVVLSLLSRASSS